MNIDEVTVFKCCQIKFTSLLKFWRTLGEGRARERGTFQAFTYAIASLP